MHTPLVLASSSPRRYELLKQLDLEFMVKPSNVVEKIDNNVDPAQLAMKLAREKSREVAGKLNEGIVIGADTLVVFRDRILEKPESKAKAREMLSLLSGNQHKVITGVALVNAASQCELFDSLETSVWFKELCEKEIERYISTGEPLDKAGAYGIQGYGSIFVERIEGCYYNVVGLSLCLLGKMLNSFGLKI